MGQGERKVLPIVDAEGRYESMLHYGAFAENILTKINPHKKAVIPTSISHLLATIKAQPIVVHDEDVFFKARIVVAALETKSFMEHLHREPVENTVVIVGDREDVQRIGNWSETGRQNQVFQAVGCNAAHDQAGAIAKGKGHRTRTIPGAKTIYDLLSH
jgi:hypothetical protein